MLRPSSRCVALVIAAVTCLVASMGCSRDASRSHVAQVGRFNLGLTPPPGWEHLDHGRQQLFRIGETELALEDAGPVTARGLTRELLEARELWMAGRRRDALARVRTLHGPPISLMPSQARADFWRPWTDVTYIPDLVDSASLGGAFDELIREADALPPIPDARIVEYVLGQLPGADRREVAHSDSLKIHGADWLSIETWNRVSHMDRQKVAFLDVDGYLLLLTSRRGPIEQSGAAFDSLLGSIEVLPAR